MKIYPGKRAMLVRVVLLVVGIVILSASECDMKPVGPGGDKPVTFAYICPNGTVTAGTAPAKNTEKCSACNTGFNLNGAKACVASPGTIAYICTNGAIAEGIAGAEDTEKCSACDEGFNLTANTCVASAPVVSVPTYQHPLASTLVPAGPFSLARSAKVTHTTTLASGDGFGNAVAFAGDLDGDGGTVLAVGAIADDTGGDRRGAIYLLSYNAAGALQTTKKIAHGVDETNAADTLAPTLANLELFGSSIANAGDLYGNGTTVLAVGSVGDTTFKGAIYLLSFNDSGNLTATTKIGSTTTNGPTLAVLDHFGSSLAHAGDLDGGGGTVLAVGAIKDNTGRSNEGAIYLLSFDPNGTLQNTKKIASGLDETNAGSNALAPTLADGNEFGYSIAHAGDLDGGGGTVLAVGAASGGAIHLLSFSTAGALQSSKKIASGVDETNTAHTLAPPLVSGAFGRSLANAGDLNGNGGTVLFVGANLDDTNGADRGAIYLLSFGTTGSLTATPTKIASGTDNGPVLTNNYFFGASLASAGNLDGNGGRVLAVGGYGDSTATNKTGELQLLYFTPPAED